MSWYRPRVARVARELVLALAVKLPAYLMLFEVGSEAGRPFGAGSRVEMLNRSLARVASMGTANYLSYRETKYRQNGR